MLLEKSINSAMESNLQNKIIETLQTIFLKFKIKILKKLCSKTNSSFFYISAAFLLAKNLTLNKDLDFVPSK